MTYNLEAEREGKKSDHACDYKGGRNNIQAAGGEGGLELRSQLQQGGSNNAQTGGGEGGLEVRSQL